MTFRPFWQHWDRARIVGIGALLALAALQLGVDWSGEISIRMRVFDYYQRHYPRERSADPVVIVAIDDASLKTLGQWPWRRTKFASLLDHIAAEQPLAIGVDVIFAEEASPACTIDSITNNAATAPQSSPDDAVLETSIKTAPIVLGVGGLERSAPFAAHINTTAGIRQFGAPASPWLPTYPAGLHSIAALEKVARGQGVINSIISNVTRQVPTAVTVNESLQPGFALEVLRVAAQQSHIGLHTDTRGVDNATMGAYRIATDPNGAWWLHFSDASARPAVSAASVLDGSYPKGIFAGRIVLIGYTALGLQDNVSSPLGQMAGIHVHAEAIENLVAERLLSRPNWAEEFEVGLLLCVGLLVIFALPTFGPARVGAGFIVVLAASALACVAVFLQQGWLIDPLYPAVNAAVVFALLLGLSLAWAQAQRRRLAQELAVTREQQARLEGELDAAKRIQMGMLPHAQTVLGDESRVAIAALMQPARTVGGDLYDFFFVDKNRLFFLVGDVSGKGLPASLFMALAKAMTKSAALRCDGDPAKALTQAAAEISCENPEYLFITALAGLIDLNTGRLTWCSAGHEAPFLLSQAHKPIQRLDSAGGPPLCVIDGFTYQNAVVQLASGDQVCLITDGITEAQNIGGDFYGMARLDACFAAHFATTVQVLVDAVATDVAEFAAAAEPVDDLTILAVSWHSSR